MGTKLPLYGYIDPETKGTQSRAVRQQQVRSVETFLRYISRPDVRRHKRNIIVDGEFNPQRDEWVRTRHLETDCYERPQLRAIIERIEEDEAAGRAGTIVVPTTDDLRETKTAVSIDLIERIIADKITILAVCDPEFPLSQFLTDDGADWRIFEAMSSNVLSTRNTLEAFVKNRDRMVAAQ